ncbi:MAG: GGDEF domain-containing protein [Candidatus Omnitrophica bacterium]|nr:GGDEF domain-containing protein [Candidatus Omnitrophota bacterium]
MNEFLFLIFLAAAFLIKKDIKYRIIILAVSFFVIIYIRHLSLLHYLPWLFAYAGVFILSALDKNIACSSSSGFDLKHADIAKQLKKSEQKLTEMEKVNKQLQFEVTKITGFFEISKELTKVMYVQQLPPVIINIVKGSFEIDFLALLILEEEKSCTIFVYPNRNSYEIKEHIDFKNIVDSEKIIMDEESGFYDGKDLMPLFAKLGHGYSQNKMYLIPIILEGKIKSILMLDDLPEDKIDLAHTFAGFLSLTLRKLKLYGKVQELAITDELTQVFVRRHFQDVYAEELQRLKDKKSEACFLMLDLDKFKNCNDSFGHLVGDILLKETASIIQQNVREVDLVGRYGGEEFCIFLPETNLENGMLVAERIRKAVEKNNFRAYDEMLKITVSIGISCYPQDASESVDLIEKADLALYSAKRKGRNRTIAYNAIK